MTSSTGLIITLPTGLIMCQCICATYQLVPANSRSHFIIICYVSYHNIDLSHKISSTKREIADTFCKIMIFKLRSYTSRMKRMIKNKLICSNSISIKEHSKGKRKNKKGVILHLRLQYFGRKGKWAYVSVMKRLTSFGWT